MLPEGFILVDKPVGWSSFDVVNFIRSYLSSQTNLKKQQIKVGHSGTLDPFASGLMIIMIGKKYTKQANVLLGLKKTYFVKAKLGFISDTYDLTGNIEYFCDQRPSNYLVKQTIRSFCGISQQIPPKFSALKINGQRSYILARSGQNIVLKPRLIIVYKIDSLIIRYPFLSFKITVSSGTYIRSIVNDLGKMIKTGAYCQELRRLRIGNFSIEKALKIEHLKTLDLNQFSNKLFKTI